MTVQRHDEHAASNAEGDRASGGELPTDAGREGQQKSIPQVRSLERALNILEQLARAQGEIGLSELSDCVNLHISTVHRLLSVLVRHKYAYQRPSTGRYLLGKQAVRLSTWALDVWQRELRREARHVFDEIIQELGESVNLAVLVGDQVQYIDQASNQDSVRVVTKIGGYAPLYRTGVGKAILAHQTDDEIARYLETLTRKVAREGQPAKTKSTITNPMRLRRQLAQIRRRGVAFDIGEFEADVHCVAVPVFDNTGQVSAAISLSGPAVRFNQERMRKAAPVLKKRVRQLSRDLGWQPQSEGRIRQSES